MATLGNATDFGDLSGVRSNFSGTCSSTRGVTGGGRTPSQVSIVDLITFASTGNGQDFGDLTAARDKAAGVSNSIRAIFCGGDTDGGPSNVNTIDYFNISGGGTATDFGDLTAATRDFAGSSNGHGGLDFDTGILQRPSVTYMPGSGRAIFQGGESPVSAVADYVHISTLGNAVDWGDLSQARQSSAGIGTLIKGFVAGGALASGYTDDVDETIFATRGNYARFGDLTNDRSNLGGLNNATRGVFGGGYSPNPGSRVDIIDYITLASGGTGSDFGNLTVAADVANNAAASSTRGLWMGKGAPAAKTIDYITIASTGNAADFGDMVADNGIKTGCSNSIRAVGAVGYNSNVIEYLTIASTGNATDFGDLTVARGGGAAAASPTRAIFAGGQNPGVSNIIDYITIASTGDAADFGDRLNALKFFSGATESHGGLSG